MRHLTRPIQHDVLFAAQSFISRFVHSREPGLLKRLVVPDHLCDTLGGEEDHGHTVSVEACQDVLIGPFGDRADMRLAIRCVAHYYRNKEIRVSPGEAFIAFPDANWVLEID